MINTTLCDTLLRGINTIRRGIFMSQLLDILGIPDDRSIKNKPLILKYGSIEFTFDIIEKVYTLSNIYLYMDPQLKSIKWPTNICAEGWWPDATTTRQLFIDYCKCNKITLNIYTPLTFDTQMSFITDNDALIIFENTDNDFYFNKIMLYTKRINEKLGPNKKRYYGQ